MKKSGIIYTRKSLPAPSFFSLKHILFIICLIFLFSQKKALGFQNNSNQNIISVLKSNLIPPTVTLTPTPTLSPTPTPTPVILPQRLIIEKLKINAEIEYLGVENERMQAPQNFNNAGWFAPGMPPGGPGNSVIGGHFDTNHGAPAIFYRLGKLIAGDIIRIESIFGHNYTFRVTGKEIYPYNDAPTDYIFADIGTSRLILVTCTGIFKRTLQTYTNRIVVYSELINQSGIF